MQDTQAALLDNVKATVVQFGLKNVTTRRLSEVSGINNGLIYHYFQDLNDVLLSAYCRENSAIFVTVLRAIEEVRDIPFDFRTKARLWFHRTWKAFLSDPARLIFCTEFYHSVLFKGAEAFHQKQVKTLVNEIGRLFKSENDCIQTMYSLLSMIYDAAKRVVEGNTANTPETEELMFSMCYGALCSQVQIPL